MTIPPVGRSDRFRSSPRSYPRHVRENTVLQTFRGRCRQNSFLFDKLPLLNCKVVESDSLRSLVGGAVESLGHSVGYARHLVLGNRVAGGLSVTEPGLPPVVLSHGFLGTRGTMLPLGRRFQSDGRAVFSYRHGRFQLKSLRASADELIRQLRDLEARTGVRGFDVVGFSMGGLIALHALKFMQGQRWIRRLALLGTPTQGTWMGLAGVATMGLVSPSVWQCLPGSGFLRDLREAPVPPGVRIRQIYGREDAFCPVAPRLAGVDANDYCILPGGHSSLVMASQSYACLQEFFTASAPVIDHDAISTWLAAEAM